MKILQLWFGKKIPKQNLECINQVKEFANSNNIIYQFIQKKEVKDFKLAMYESDKLRFELAIKEPELLYLDCDVILNYIPKFEFKDKPYFHNFNGQLVSGVFYNNNCFSFFEKLFKDSVNRNIQPQNGWSTKIIRNKSVYEFDPKSFNHKMFSYQRIMSK